MPQVWDDDTQAFYNDFTPRRHVRLWVDRQHVGTGDDEIARKLHDMIGKSPDRERFTHDIIEETIRYALAIHKRNRDLYRAVMTGRF